MHCTYSLLEARAFVRVPMSGRNSHSNRASSSISSLRNRPATARPRTKPACLLAARTQPVKVHRRHSTDRERFLTEHLRHSYKPDKRSTLEGFFSPEPDLAEQCQDALRHAIGQRQYRRVGLNQYLRPCQSGSLSCKIGISDSRFGSCNIFKGNPETVYISFNYIFLERA